MLIDTEKKIELSEQTIKVDFQKTQSKASEEEIRATIEHLAPKRPNIVYVKGYIPMVALR